MPNFILLGQIYALRFISRRNACFEVSKFKDKYEPIVEIFRKHHSERDIMRLNIVISERMKEIVKINQDMKNDACFLNY